MPWTIADVEKHKKGLDAKGKAKWVATANAALASCIKKGGTDATCAPQAIRIANGVTGNSLYSVYKNKQEAYTVETRQHQGAAHLVIPVVMMVEGVHNGNHGPMYHSIDELGKFPAAWNGIPVVIDHPEIEGQNVSANDPDIIDQRTVGRVYNTKVVGQKLVAEAWINEERVRQLSATILATIQRRDKLEVSLGMFSEEEETSGTWNGETYESIARNHRPDHLALLPGGRGACSIEDGCGLGANNNNNKEGGNDVNELEFNKALKDFYVSQLNTNEAGYKELVDAARSKIDSMDSESSIHFLQEVFEDFLIYEVRLRIGGSKTYKQNYEFKDGAVELKGNPEEVRKKVEYVALAEGSGIERTISKNKLQSNEVIKKEDLKMAKEPCAPCIKQKIDDLIANSQGKYTEDDREMLETLSEALLDKIAKPIEVVKEVNVLSEEDKAALATYKKQLKDKRDELINTIQTNLGKETWTDEVLGGMTDEVLEKVVLLVNKGPVDYSLKGGSSGSGTVSKEEPLPPTGVKFK